MNKFASDAADAGTKILQRKVITTGQPGSRSRKSVRLYLEDGSVIATRRDIAERAALEALVLRELQARKAPVPRVIAFKDGWLIQEDLGERRLSQALNTGCADKVEAYLDAALEALAEIHAAGRAAGLEKRVVVIGQKPNWLRTLIETPRRIGETVGVPAPGLPVEEIIQVLMVAEPQLIKWDARPGNAIVCDDGSLAWFDFEHCGCRSPLDDVAWLLCDEYTPDRPEIEQGPLARHLTRFAGEMDGAQASAYLAIFGTLHMCVRLALILSKKGDGSWWDPKLCLAADKVGVTKAAAQRLCARGARWSGNSALTEGLIPWFGALSDRIGELN